MSQIFNYFDKKAMASLPCFPSINSATAIRETLEHLRTGRIPRAHATDFAIYLVADQDPETMRVLGLESPKHILDVHELLKELDRDGEPQI